MDWIIYNSIYYNIFIIYNHHRKYNYESKNWYQYNTIYISYIFSLIQTTTSINRKQWTLITLRNVILIHFTIISKSLLHMPRCALFTWPTTNHDWLSPQLSLTLHSFYITHMAITLTFSKIPENIPLYSSTAHSTINLQEPTRMIEWSNILAWHYSLT